MGLVNVDIIVNRLVLMNEGTDRAGGQTPGTVLDVREVRHRVVDVPGER